MLKCNPCMPISVVMSMLIPENLKIVVLECPFESWANPLVQDLFSKMVSLKKKGYGKEYPVGTLPLDTADFIAQHHFICEQKNGELIPLTGYRATTAKICKRYSVGFTPISFLKYVGSQNHTLAQDHILAIERIVEQAEREKTGVCYFGSWTIDPKVRKNEQLVTTLRDIMSGMNVLCTEEYGIGHSLTAPVLRFKLDEYFGSIGYNPLQLDGQVLPKLPSPFLSGDKFMFVHATEFSDYAKACAKDIASLWKNRITLESELDQVKKAA